RSRQPELIADFDGFFERAPADAAQPIEAVAEHRRRAVVEAALDRLSPRQREAIDLAFRDDLTHEQVAARLGVPPGPAKTRIRDGIQKLRVTLAPHGPALAALCLLIALGIRYGAEHATLARYDRALSMVTASDSVNLRLGALPGTPEDAHARYRSRPGVGVAVVTFSKFAPAPAGATYQAWVRHAGKWSSLGMVEPDADGNARLIAEDPALSVLPDELEVTVEPRRGSTAPSGRVVVAWAP